MKAFKIVGINNSVLRENLEITQQVSVPSNPGTAITPNTVEKYDTSAVVPIANWRKLIDIEYRNYVCEAEVFAFDSLAFIKLSTFDFNFVKRFSRSFRGPKIMPNLLKELKRTIRRYISIEGEFEVLGVFSSDANLTSVTRSKGKKFIGMHVDNWDEKEIPQRNNARSRICVNLGPGSRYFLYCPIRFIEECADLEIQKKGL